MNETIAASAGEGRLLTRGSRTPAGTGDPLQQCCVVPLPPPLKTLHMHLGQRAGHLVLAGGLAVQTAVASDRVLRGGEQEPLISQEGVRKKPAWRAGEVSAISPEGHSGRSRGPLVSLAANPSPLGLSLVGTPLASRDLGSGRGGGICWAPEGRWVPAQLCRRVAGGGGAGPRCAGRRRRRHSPAGKSLTSEGLVFVRTRPRQPAAVLCCAGPGGSRQKLPPSSGTF